MKKYDSYKESKVQWVGQIPSHWEERKAKYVFSFKKNVVGERCNEYDLLSLTLQGVIKRDLENPTGKFPSSFNTYQEVNSGDFIFCLFDNEETPRTVGLSDFAGMITGAYDVFVQKNGDINSRYLLYYYLTIDDSKLFKPLYKGLRKTIPFDSFMRYRIPIPPATEQNIIVSYLDEKTAEIDEQVSKVEREIELLKEFKQTEIARVVTKGLNPNIKMKPSGISWIGDIPEHWSIRKMKYTFDERSEKNHPDEPILCATQSLGVIPQSMYENRVVVVNKGFENLKFVKEGDFVISLRSFQGGIEYAHYQGIISAAYTILCPNCVIDSGYARILLKSHQFIQLLKTCVTGIREGQNINYDILKNKFLPIPPIEEQKGIAEYVDRKTTEIDRLIVELTYQAEYLKEYKQRLIADVVTGKINVQPD